MFGHAVHEDNIHLLYTDSCNEDPVTTAPDASPISRPLRTCFVNAANVETINVSFEIAVKVTFTIPIAPFPQHVSSSPREEETRQPTPWPDFAGGNDPRTRQSVNVGSIFLVLIGLSS
jgi:hypothetical protein